MPICHRCFVKVEILGSGGAIATPRPGCLCRVCVEGRERGLPYSRTGPSTFVHGPDVLFDTPEEARSQLDRAGIAEITACFYSHWHPDHTMGRRVWETRNGDFRTWPPKASEVVSTDVYLPQQVAADFRTYLGHWEHFEFLEAHGYIRLHELRDGETATVRGYEIRPFRLAEDYVYAFEVVGDGKRLLLAPDELNGWKPPDELRDVDLAMLPLGICEFDPLTGERRIHPDHPVLRYEATFAETLEIVDALQAKRVILSHIEEMDCLTHDDLLAVERSIGRNVEFAYDGMIVAV